MNIVDREWSKHPPKFKRLTLKNLVADFHRRRAAEWSILSKNRDDIVDYCRDAPSLQLAIQRACRSKRPNGKHHNHQSKVKSTVLFQLESRLRHGARAIKRCTDFAALYNYIDVMKPVGIGPITTYDVAVRIGAHLFLEPQEVYLHAGCRAGMQALLNSPALPRLRRVSLKPHVRHGVVPIAALPVELSSMSADNVEDFLCVYRTVFQDCQR